MKVRSTKYPSLIVTDPKVRFVDGEAEVSDLEAEALRNYAALGVKVPEPEEKSEPAKRGRPKKTDAPPSGDE